MTLLPNSADSFPMNLPRLSRKILKENNLSTRQQLIDFASTHFLEEMRFSSGQLIGKLTLKSLQEILPENCNPVEAFYMHFSTKAVTVLKREKITSKSELVVALTQSKQIKNARGVGVKLLADFEEFLARD
jgi:hypothetical protein